MAIDFEASSSQWISLGATLASLQNLAGCTLTVWVNAESDGNGVNIGRSLLGFSTGTSNLNSRAVLQHLEINGGTDQWRAASRRLDANASSVAAGSTVTTGSWTFIAATFGWATGHLILYVNGVQVTDTSIGAWSANSSNTTSNDAAIAASPDGTTNFFDGVEDDGRVYNRVLSATEIMTLYVVRGRDRMHNGLIHRWKMNEGGVGATASGADGVKDCVGTLHGTATASPVYAAGVISHAARAYGSS